MRAAEDAARGAKDSVYDVERISADPEGTAIAQRATAFVSSFKSRRFSWQSERAVTGDGPAGFPQAGCLHAEVHVSHSDVVYRLMFARRLMCVAVQQGQFRVSPRVFA